MAAQLFWSIYYHPGTNSIYTHELFVSINYLDPELEMVAQLVFWSIYYDFSCSRWIYMIISWSF